jgi:hypothetical protein
MRLALGVILALAAAIALNWSFFTQHQATNSLPALSLRHPLRSLWSLFKSGRWLLGYVVGLGGWGLYMAALVFAPISIVQAVSAGGVGMLALLIWRSAHLELVERDRAAIAACFAGLVLLFVSFAAGVPQAGVPETKPIVVWVAATAALAALSWGLGARWMRAGAGLGAAAGLLYAAGDVSTKAAIETSLWFAPVLIACLVLGFVALQLAFQRGTAMATAGLATLLNNSIPIVAGVTAFHERLPAGVLGGVRIVAFVFVVLGAALLARPEQAELTVVSREDPATAVAGER